MHKLIIDNLTLRNSDGVEALKKININIPVKKITVIFGPSGGGKSSLLRVINHLNDLTDVDRISGKVLLFDKKDHSKDILDPNLDVINLRRSVGMVFARPVVLPLSIRNNIT
jgi:phosphate transport system ATP-binding protein